MLNMPLFAREMKNSVKLLVIIGAVLAMYVSIIIGMYDPAMMNTLDQWVDMMPELMSAMGMKAGAASILGFMSSYLYGFVLPVCPMVFCILRGHGLVARYVENNAMVSLLAAPVKRRTVAFTQMKVLASGVFLLVLFSTVLEIVCCEAIFPGALDMPMLLLMNVGLLCLLLFIGGICFLASCLFSDSKYSLGIGAGVPLLAYVLQMLANMGGDAEAVKYATFFTLYNPDALLAGENGAVVGIVALFIGALVLFACGIAAFSRRDFHI